VKAEGVRNYALFFGTVPVTLLLVSVISTAFFTDFEVKSEEQKPSDELYKKMTKDSSRNNKIYATQKP